MAQLKIKFAHLGGLQYVHCTMYILYIQYNKINKIFKFLDFLFCDMLYVQIFDDKQIILKAQ